jgi:SAM-dependent methyltransferase
MPGVRHRLAAARRRFLGLEGLDPHLSAIEGRMTAVEERLGALDQDVERPGGEVANLSSPVGGRAEGTDSDAGGRWTFADVVDVSYSAFAVRTYREQTDVRRYLATVASAVELRAACDVGAGYGRMALLLEEVCPHVVAFERQKEFVKEGRSLLPSIDFRHVGSLTDLPSPTGVFDFALTFTVLQHLIDPVMKEAVDEIKRVVGRPGFVLLCEETDEGHVAGDVEDPNGSCTIGRSVERYRSVMSPFELVATSPRRIEPTYERSDVGTYMLFRSADA